MHREARPRTVAVTTDASTTEIVDIRDMAGLSVEIPAGMSMTSLAVYSTLTDPNDASPVTPVVFTDADDTAVTVTVAADGVFEVPAAVYNAPWICFVGSHAEDILLFAKS